MVVLLAFERSNGRAYGKVEEVEEVEEVKQATSV
jgi:hypothetical protein